MYNSIICRYNEIATKGNNRSMFENMLMRNMRTLIKPDIPEILLRKMRGRIYIYKDGFTVFTEEEKEMITERLKRVFGLDSFSFCMEGPREFNALMQMIRDEVIPLFEEQFAKGNSVVKFRTRARRSDHTFPMCSRDIEIEVATMLEKIVGEDHLKVDLTDPDISIGVEIRENNSSVFLETEKAAGGLPVGSNAAVLGLLSGGIDSPVACVMAMQRGCRMDYLTFHSYPYTPMESVEKVLRISQIVNRWQPHGTLFACNLSEIQKLIRDNCDPRCRTVLYRRMMMRIASMLCRKRKLSAIVTGEAVGQVASQTVENMGVINQTVPDLILRPLCGMDKNETIIRARNIGTFETSIEPMIDSCTVFAPDSPVLHAKLPQIEYEESRIPDLQAALQAAYDDIDIVTNDENGMKLTKLSEKKDYHKNNDNQ